MNETERLLSAALDAKATTAVPDERPAPAFTVPSQSARRWVAPLLAAAAVVAIAVGTTVAVRITAERHHARPGVSSTVAPTPSPSTPAPSTSGPSPSTSPPSSSSSPPSATGTFQLGYQPLWPFADNAEAEQWWSQGRLGGHQPWHADAGQTALSFTRGYLGFTEQTIVTSSSYDSVGAHIGVGYVNPNGTHMTSAVLHLVRFGTHSDSPWEVVGSDDTSFSLEQPAYGSRVTSPMTVGGHITGVDENIKVSVRTLSGSVTTTCCSPAGGVAMPWGMTVPFSASGVLTIVASTGGHLLGVERFAIQGVRA